MKCSDFDKGANALDLLHENLKTLAYMATYKTLIKPILNHTYWDDVEAKGLLPLIVKKQIGRPKNA